MLRLFGRRLKSAWARPVTASSSPSVSCPTRPETGYGYIRAIPQGAAAVPVESFVEKPDADTAKKYVDSGEYFWNSGMFLFRADAYLDALKQFAPGIHECCRRSIEQRQTDGNLRASGY